MLENDEESVRKLVLNNLFEIDEQSVRKLIKMKIFGYCLD